MVVEQSQAEALAAAAAAGDNLICQAIINSGIALETEEGVVEQVVEEVPQAAEEAPKDAYHCPDAEDRLTGIQVTEEFVEMEAEESEVRGRERERQDFGLTRKC